MSFHLTNCSFNASLKSWVCVTLFPFHEDKGVILSDRLCIFCDTMPLHCTVCLSHLWIYVHILQILTVFNYKFVSNFWFEGRYRGDPEAAVGRGEAEGRAAEPEAPQGRGGQRQDEQDYGVSSWRIQLSSPRILWDWDIQKLNTSIVNVTDCHLYQVDFRFNLRTSKTKWNSITLLLWDLGNE